MEKINILKEEGNNHYKQGCKLYPDNTAETSFRNSCLIYGNCIEEMVQFEGSCDDNNVVVLEEYQMLKPTIFLNLAAANLKLQHFEGCKRCCNSCIVFCNHPNLSLDEMGIDDDLTLHVQIHEPVNPSRKNIACKALYRRGLCYMELSDFEYALIDFQAALRINPNGKDIKNAIEEVKKQILNISNHTQRPEDDSQKQAKAKPLLEGSKSIKSLLPELGVNGGYCLYRKGIWSQNINFVTANIPINAIIDLDINTDITSSSSSSNADEAYNFYDNLKSKELKSCAKSISVVFNQRSIEVFMFHSSSSSSLLVLSEGLEYNIITDECTWTLEINPDTDVGVFLVLYMHKAPSLEWFPGCEWWDRLFDSDEPIETTTCSLGTAINELPVQAHQRAEIEHFRIMNLSSNKRHEEIDNLSKLKTDFLASEMKTRVIALAEDEAVGDIPERAHLLSDLRKQFPNIDFTAR